MKKPLFILLLLNFSYGTVFSQKTPEDCSAFMIAELYSDQYYNTFGSHFELEPGERVASVGARSGYIEVLILGFVQNLKWTLQDIDSTCLNDHVFQSVLTFYERAKGSPINADFELVLGEETVTHLPRNTYDRIIMIDVYHELSDKESIIKDVFGALKEDGVFVVLDKVAKKSGTKRHAVYEPDFIEVVTGVGFSLNHKTMATVMKEKPDSYYKADHIFFFHKN